MTASATAAFSYEDPADSLHWRARLFVDESPAGLCSNCLGNVFINFTFLKTHVKKSHSDTQGRLKRYGMISGLFWASMWQADAISSLYSWSPLCSPYTLHLTITHTIAGNTLPQPCPAPCIFSYCLGLTAWTPGMCVHTQTQNQEEVEEQEDEGGGRAERWRRRRKMKEEEKASAVTLKPYRVTIGQSANKIQGINWDKLLIWLLDSQLWGLFFLVHWQF